jgi:hypothetical protein
MTDIVTISRASLQHVANALDQCKAEVDEALAAPPPPSGLREALAVTEQAKQFIHGNESVFGGHPEYDQGWQGACDHIAEQLRLASPDDGWVTVDEEHPLPGDLKPGDETRCIFVSLEQLINAPSGSFIDSVLTHYRRRLE